MIIQGLSPTVLEKFKNLEAKNIDTPPYSSKHTYSYGALPVDDTQPS